MLSVIRRKLVVALAIAAATLGLSAVSAAPASAHYGDWYTQYVRTANFAYDHWGYTHYRTSTILGEHSRSFIYAKPGANGWITRQVQIGHTYSIFAWDAFAWVHPYGIGLHCDRCATSAVRG